MALSTPHNSLKSEMTLVRSMLQEGILNKEGNSLQLKKVQVKPQGKRYSPART